MTYGAYINESDSFGWVTPEVTPMMFYRKLSTSLTFGGATTILNIDLGVSKGEIIIPFIQFSTNQYAPYTALKPGSVNWTLEVKSGFSYTITLSVYIFKIVLPQPFPSSKYGIAIFNANGQCILTNESNPLRILEEITLRGVPGPNIPSETKTYQNRSVAVFPRATGNIVGSISNPPGPPILRPSFKSYVAGRSGGSTVVTPMGSDEAVGTPSSFYAPYVKTYVIDTSIYD